MAKVSNRLVVKHLESIPRKALVKYPEISKKYLSGNLGIYALYLKEQLRYIGVAPNLLVRLNAHHRNQTMPKWDRFSVYFTELLEYDNELEALIGRMADLNPKRKRKAFRKSETLRFLFLKDVAQIREMEAYGNISLEKLKTPTKKTAAKPAAKKKAVARKKPAAKPKAKKKPVAKPKIKAAKKTVTKKKTAQKPKAPQKLSTIMPYINRRFYVYAKYKNNTYKATVRANGLIFYKGGLYTSPSSAAKAVTGAKVDGWRFWKYKTKKGKWVPLSTLKTG